MVDDTKVVEEVRSGDPVGSAVFIICAEYNGRCSIPLHRPLHALAFTALVAEMAPHRIRVRQVNFTDSERAVNAKLGLPHLMDRLIFERFEP